MCCVLQTGAERVFPTRSKLQQQRLAQDSKDEFEDQGSPLHDLPLESLWAAGLDDGMGFPQRCSYANQRSHNANNIGAAAAAASTPEDGWLPRNTSYR